MVKKNVRDNVIYVSNGFNTHKQYGREINVEEMHWISGNPFKEDQETLEISFKTRHSPEFYGGIVRRIEDGSYRIESETDVQGIAPGQFAIIYTPDRRLCLGSGMISTPARKKKNS